jgi:DNA-directed RNA polymerase subunit RPC12/RpoP
LRCKGICYRFAAKKPLGGYRFAAGQRPCSICGIFVNSLYAGIRCPCCNNKLRLNSRNTKSRKNRFNLNDYAILKKASNLMKSVNGTIHEPDQVITAKLVLNK